MGTVDSQVEDRPFLKRGTTQADEASHFQPLTTLPQTVRQRVAREALSTAQETANVTLKSRNDQTDPPSPGLSSDSGQSPG
jgi:hypothetical protein